MADPRLSSSVEGVGAEYVTLLHDGTIVFDAAQDGGSASVGLAVTTEGRAAGTVGLVGDAERVTGKLIAVESDGLCTVQVKGGMTLPGGTAATLSEGFPIVGDLLVAAEGYIREAALATLAEVARANGEIINAGTSTAVEVIL